MSYTPAFTPVTAFAPLPRERLLISLLSVLNQPPRGTEYGLVERSACRLALGLTDQELDTVVRLARQRGYVDSQPTFDRIAITARGLAKLQQPA